MVTSKHAVFAIMSCLCFTSVWTVPTEMQGCRRSPSSISIRIKKDNCLDLTYAYDEASAVWPTDRGFSLIEQFKGFILSPVRYYLEVNAFNSPEHAGTHIDAPVHTSQNQQSVDEVPLQNLMGLGVLIDLVKDGKRFDSDALVTTNYILDWERTHGRIRSGSIVLLRTGFGDVYYDREKYFGTNLTGDAGANDLHFPGIDPDAARWLVSHRCIAAIGLDTPSIDFGQSKEFKAHQIFGGQNIPVFENVGNLKQLGLLNTKGFNIIALPYKIRGGSGGPVRIVAVLK